MDTTLLIGIVIAIIIAYFLIKFIVSPVIKIIVGVITIIVLIYLLQRFFGFDIDKALAPLGISLNLNEWIQNFDWIMNPINYIIDQINNFIAFIWGNINKSLNKQ